MCKNNLLAHNQIYAYSKWNKLFTVNSEFWLQLIQYQFFGDTRDPRSENRLKNIYPK